MKKYYYAVRFLGGNRTCTTGQPNKTTGRMSKAIQSYAFTSDADRTAWINEEKLSSPSGLSGGERIAVTKKQLRSLSLGESINDFNEKIENLHWQAENDF